MLTEGLIHMAEIRFSGQTKNKLQPSHLLSNLNNQVKDKFELWLNQHIETGEILKSSNISANTGFAPKDMIALEVIIQLNGVVITSSPLLMFKDFNAKYNALLPDDIPIAYLVFK